MNDYLVAAGYGELNAVKAKTFVARVFCVIF